MTITFNAQDGILVRTDSNKLNNGIVEDVICTFTFIDDYDEPELLIRYGFDYEYLELANGSCTLPQDVFECPTLTLQLISDDKESLPCVVAITNIKSPKYIVPKGSIELTQNGTYNIADKATAIVNVEDTPTPSQEKSVTINSNTTTEVTPDEGNLLSKVTITTNVPSSGGGVEEVSTNAEMTAKLTSENVGKYYKFTGATDSDYVNGDLYLVELPQLEAPTGLTIDGTTLSWDEVENAESYDVYADGVLIGNTTGGASVKHYLIFSGSGLVVSVNDNVVTSGYELKNADVINIDNNIGTISGIKTNSTLVVNGTTYTGMSDDINLNLSNTDINISYTAGSGFAPYVGFTINYTQ